MSTPFLILAALFLAGSPAVFQNTPAPATTAPGQVPQTGSPPAAATPPAQATPSPSAGKPNPVHPTAESQARAKRIYNLDCAMCHGADGSGKGDITQTTKMLDYRDPGALKGLTDGQIFDIIKTGKGDNMPGEGPRANTDETWNLVIYLRSFAKQSAESHGPS
jgi:mono/diheme cytochrome c family protein